MTNKIVTITGNSCGGKTTLINMLMATGEYSEIVSTTTRPQRVGEVSGSTYHYVTADDFDKIDMLERINYNGNWYGGSIDEFEKGFSSGLVPVIIVEPNGLKQINQNAGDKHWNVLNVFIDCPKLLQANRFLDRFLEDYGHLNDFSDQEISQLMKEYSSRMVSMQVVEHDWRKQFLSFAFDENPLVIDEFNPDNEEQFIAQINDYVKDWQ